MTKTWNPRPHILARVKSYLEGYHRNERKITGGRQYLADKLKMGIRTLARYLSYLSKIGWLKTKRRPNQTAVREVAENPSGPSGGPSGLLIQAKPEVKTTQSISTSNAGSSETPHHRATFSEIVNSTLKAWRKFMAPREVPMSVGYDEIYQDYIEIFKKARKKLNELDFRRGYAAWRGLSPQDWQGAIEDIHQRVRKGTKPEYLPFPVNHLLSQAWTRTVDAEAVQRAADEAQAAAGYFDTSKMSHAEYAAWYRHHEGLDREPEPRRA